ncbi:MAG: hypothetical protein JW884_07805 [Deltaproteobacteria bacterium]|nr:hypothetical protein [Deltaproteobacteria bacterium]
MMKDVCAGLPVNRFNAAVVAIALSNESSVALNEKMEFKEVGRFEETGWKQSRWIDVGCRELVLDKEKRWHNLSAKGKK